MLPVSSAVYRVAASVQRATAKTGAIVTMVAANLTAPRQPTCWCGDGGRRYGRRHPQTRRSERAAERERDALTHRHRDTHTRTHKNRAAERERERESEGGRAREDAERYLLERERTPEPEVGGLLRPPSVTPTTVHSALMSCTRTCLHHPAKPAPARLKVLYGESTVRTAPLPLSEWEGLREQGTEGKQGSKLRA